MIIQKMEGVPFYHICASQLALTYTCLPTYLPTSNKICPGDDPHTIYLHAVLASTSSIAPGACITQQPAPRGSRWPGVQRCISSNECARCIA